ncbi:MAG: helix-turn-helix domain-containing protein [Defluviitaleaceae bacterium]|nr:helix-turn-helix domain-containing protein [Defluviitaleaceae bacterium]
MQILASRLKATRLERNLSQAELAKRSEISLSGLQFYESDHSNPTAEVIARLCIQLDISADYLLGLNDDPTFRK